jgi:predicted ATPase
MWLSKYTYCSKVFVLPPWQAIYVNDAERDHTFEHAEWVSRVVQEWYRRCRYQLIEVPKASVAERCAYVLQALENSDACRLEENERSSPRTGPRRSAVLSYC